MAGKVDDKALPPKDNSIFRLVVKCYESKQYKKGIKAADQLLKKYPDHGETLAMKGLILNCQERKEEAYEYVRKGLKNDLKSHVCWHVYGLLYRSDREYDEAIKCYKNALRQDAENMQILKDLAHLQIQMRDVPGFIETRATLLRLKPAQRQNWISYAVSHHLNRNHAVAAQILKGYEATLEQDTPPSDAFEHSEMLLYKAQVMEEGGAWEEALSELQKSKGLIKDRLGMVEMQARLYTRLGRLKKAETAYRGLIELNPDNYRFHEGLRRTLGLEAEAQGALTEDQRSRLEALYDGLQKEYPKSSAARRIPLDFKMGEKFESAADAYVRRFLERGIPSLFSDLKHLYRDSEKSEALGRLFERLLSSLEATSRLPPLPSETPALEYTPNGTSNGDALEGNGNGSAEGPSEIQTWTMLYLAQHYDRVGRTGAALAMVQRCIAGDPTLIEPYSVKAKILKHAGDLAGAAAAADKARSLDLADRYLNSVAAKALFRAGRIEDAEKTASLFTKDGDKDQLITLVEMQCMWYEVEGGRAHILRKDYGKALKRLLSVSRHFADFVEDQFDFHSYCMRKMTLRAYVHLLRMEDDVYAHPYFAKAAYSAIEVYLALADAPSAESEAAAEEDMLAAMTADERKKYKQKKRKEALKKQKGEESAAAAAAAAAAVAKAGGVKAAKGVETKKDDDPDGAALAAATDPLGEATKLLQKLKEHAGGQLQTHLLAFEVYLRKGRLLLALQGAKRAQDVGGAAHPDVHRVVVRLAQAVSGQPTVAGKAQPKAEAAPVVQEVIANGLSGLLGGKSLEQYAAGWAKANGGSSLLHRGAVAEVRAVLHPGDKKKAAAELLEGGGAVGGGFPAAALSQEDCRAVHAVLRDTLGEAAAAETFFKRAQAVFAWSEYFQGAQRPAPEEVLESTRVPGSTCREPSAIANGFKKTSTEA